MSEEIPAKEFKLDTNLNLNSEFSPPTFEEWKAQVEKDLKGASYENKLITRTYEGIDLKPIYTKSDLDNLTIADDLPGSNNFVRGFSNSGYHSNTWDVNQEIIVADVEEFNTAITHALKNGQNCINVQLDTATKLGMDADYAAKEFVGDKGLSISAISSMKRAFNNIDFKNLPLYIDTGYNVVPFLSLINAHFEVSNLEIANLNGAITADPIGHLAFYGELPVSEKLIFDMMKNSIEWTNKCAPNLKTIGISTLPIINSGANAIQELACSISTTILYINEMLDRNINPENVLENVQYTFGISNNYFMEIAKLRAARILLNTITSEYGVDSKKIDLNIGAKSSSFYLTQVDPYVNMLRTTTQTFSAILGGVNNITTSSFDQDIRIPDSFSRRISRNTQTILREESHLDQVIDPAGGSFYIETLTEEIAKKTWQFVQEIENAGGILEALKNGMIQSSIENINDQRKKDINKRKAVIVGTNMFADVNEKKLEERKFDQKAFQKKRSQYLEKFRLNGTNEKHEAIIEKLNSISNLNSAEIIDTITEAYLLGTTIGEVTSFLNSAHKKNFSIQKLIQRRASEEFEGLRRKAQEYKNSNGHLPKIYLCNYGTIKDYKARADFSKGFFEIGGFQVIDPQGSDDYESIISNTLESNAPIAVICSTDDKYPDLVPNLVPALKQKKSDITIILAGYPKDQIEEHKKNGIDEFIYLGADAMTILNSLFNKIGGTV